MCASAICDFSLIAIIRCSGVRGLADLVLDLMWNITGYWVPLYGVVHILCQLRNWPDNHAVARGEKKEGPRGYHKGDRERRQPVIRTRFKILHSRPNNYNSQNKPQMEHVSWIQWQPKLTSFEKWHLIQTMQAGGGKEQNTAMLRPWREDDLNCCRIGATQACTATVEPTARMWRGSDLVTKTLPCGGSSLTWVTVGWSRL